MCVICYYVAVTTPCLQKRTNREYVITLARNDETPWWWSEKIETCLSGFKCFKWKLYRWICWLTVEAKWNADSCWADQGILHNFMDFRCWLLWNNDTPLNPTFCHLKSVQIHIPFFSAVLIRRYHLCLQLKTQWHKITLWIKCSVWDKVMLKSLCCRRAAPSSINFETKYCLRMW